MKKYIVKINLLRLFICYISLIVIAIIIDYYFYNDIGIYYIIMALVPVMFVQLFFKQEIYIENDNFILEESNLFSSKKFTFSINDITDLKNYFIGFSIRVKDRTILLDYCKYKKSKIDNLIEYIISKRD